MSDKNNKEDKRRDKILHEEEKEERKEMPEYENQGNIAWGFRGWMILGIIAALIIFIILIFFD